MGWIILLVVIALVLIGHNQSAPFAPTTEMPTAIPTSIPSFKPTAIPTAKPSFHPTGQPTRQPTRQPTGQPTGQPTRQPTGRPTGQPSREPTRQPTRQPTGQPTGQPSRQPSGQPSRQPTGQPSRQPSGQPSTQPTRQPTRQPTGQPSRQPTSKPSGQPTRQPTMQPSRQPTGQPTGQPSRQPTMQPSRQPTSQPSGQPTGKPSRQPTGQPTRQPTGKPTGQPTRDPTGQPTRQPTTQPTGQPTRQPTTQPSRQPTRQPTGRPSRQPTGQPTRQPTRQPTGQPTRQPTTQPTGQPTRQPSTQPTGRPTTHTPTQPTFSPSSTYPTFKPTTYEMLAYNQVALPFQPTIQPTVTPSYTPTTIPSKLPSLIPTQIPTYIPSRVPVYFSLRPSYSPSYSPSNIPTEKPTLLPTFVPSAVPTQIPTEYPSFKPSFYPTSFTPTGQPSMQPSGQPSRRPTGQPSRQPTGQPTSQPTMQPTGQPTGQPSVQPSRTPSSQPISQPTSQPSRQPTGQPTRQPTRQPTGQPTRQPTGQPTGQPSRQPSSQPSSQPTGQPSSQPSRRPTGQPTRQPSRQPTGQPTTQPTRQPSSQPTRQPTTQPSRQPTGQPTRQPSSQPSRQPTGQPTSRPTAHSPSHPTAKPSSTYPTLEPTKFVQYNHTQKYNSIDSATFSVYTALWNSNHLRWKGINKEDITCGNNVYSKNQVAIFPACVDNFAVGDTLNLDSPCPAVVCPSFTDINCIPTPQDTLDYIPPPEKSPDSKNICKPDYTDDIAVPPPYYGMDEGIPPYFTPVSPTRLLITGTVIGSFGDKCTAINDAVIEAWQIDPTAITNYTARSEYLHNLERNLSAAESQRYFQSYSSSSSAQYKPESLREISCRARQVVDSAGKYSFETIMPPSYGPPRHIVFKVTAPGFETLTTRMYFDLDWRLQQLTTLNDETKTTYIPHDPGDYGAERNIATDDDHNILHYSYYNNNTGVHVVNQTNEHFTPDFPGAIAKDPRVRPVSFVTTTTKNVVFGATPGYWNVSFNLVLKSNRPSDKGSNSAIPPLNLTGLWVDYTTGGMIKVETHGYLFIATEYPHPRTWGTASGILVGDTVRGVSFRKNTYVSSGKTFVEASIDGGSVSNDNYWASGYSTGNVVMKETFSSEKLSSLSSSEMSLEWSGGDFDSGDVMATSRWGKIVDSRMKSYRYLKLAISRETGGYQYGKMVINEIEFYEGILAQRIVPAADRKMVSPRTPSPQLVTCSSFQDQFSHCYKAFDGIETSNSAWITEQVGSFNRELGEPQWILIDLGEARSIEPTAIRIVCGVDNTNTPGKTPLGCPRTFSLYGSFDNIQFDEVYSTDLLEYSNEYNNTHGKVFNFFWEAPTGRPNGHRCGSCTSGPLFTCNVDAYDGTCASKYCDNSGLCNEIPACPSGEYMDTVFIDFNKPSMRCNQCAPGRYGNVSGYTNSYCTGTCQKGYYCPAGSTSPTQIECGDNTVHCPEGSGYPVPTAAGRKSVGGEGINVDNTKNHHSDTLCSKGHYCENGIEKQCPVGRYGDMEGLSSFECTGLCLAGEYCNSGSIKPTLCEKGYYCPDGTIRYPCPVGRYGGVVGSKDAKCTGLCSPGYYCDQGSISSKEKPCPAGRYSSAPGATSKNCDGLCTEGYYCPDASTSSVANECGDETVYCPAGSGKPIAVSNGYYSIGGSPSLRTNQTKCEPGFYCKDGIKLSCPAGSYGSVAGMSNLIPFPYNFTYYPTLSPTSNSNTPSTRTPTVMPSFSPTTTRAPTIPSKVPTGQPTTQPTRQPTGQPSRQPTGQPTRQPSRQPSSQPSGKPTGQPTCQPTASPSLYGAVNTNRPSSMPTGYPTKQSDYEYKFYCSGLCSPGHYCPSNSSSSTQIPCPPGTYGLEEGLKDEKCTDVCPMGHYCPAGTVRPIKCPAGTFGNSTGLISSSCNKECFESGCDASYCEEGYYCPEGSISSRERECGDVSVYCPAGSSQPITVSTGYYTVSYNGNDEYVNTRIAQKICEKGHFCVDGVKYACPFGTYGDEEGLSSDSCSGLCPKGYYCPTGTYNGTINRCPAGRYGSSTGLYTSTCTDICDEGYYCPEGSTHSNEIECGVISMNDFDFHFKHSINSGYLSDIKTKNIFLATRYGYTSLVSLSNPNNVYCPAGSAIPILCSNGYYSSGGNRTTRVTQIACPMGTYCVDGIIYDCPAGRYGRDEKLYTPECSGLCQKGYYCPIGSTTRVQVPCPLGRYGDKEGLTNSLCSGPCNNPLDCPAGSTSAYPSILKPSF